MRLLYLGHYKEGTGWSQAAIDYILAIDSVGIDITCRNIKLTNRTGVVAPRILELEKKPLEGCDVCIQHLLPHHLVGTDHFKKNISYFVSESTSIRTTPWFPLLQQMDEVWVPNTDLLNSLENDSLFEDRDRIKLVPHTFDMTKYKKTYRAMSIKEIDYKYKFYYIGELNDRKNLESIVTSFHSEFDKSEPVALILKVKKFGLPPESLASITKDMCNIIKKRMRLYPDISHYHQEIIIPMDMPEEDIYALHQYADCFVCPSHGEGWSIPSFDAMCFGKTPICSNVGGPKDFIGGEDVSIGTCVNGMYSVCNCEDSAFPELFTGREEWFCPSEAEIKKSMRYYYENHNNYDPMAGLKRAKEYSYDNIGGLIKELLEV